MGNLLYKVSLHARRFLSTVISNSQLTVLFLKFTVLLLQLNRSLMPKIDEKSQEYDQQQRGYSYGYHTLIAQLSLLLSNLKFLFLGLVHDG